MSQQEIFSIYSKSQVWTETNRRDAVILFLTSEITRRKLKRGERFPINERDIANALNVSRQTVNNAWHKLAEQGIVEIYKGVGVVMLNPERVSPDELYLEGYLEIRKQAEIQLTRLVVKNATQEDLEHIQSKADELIQSIQLLEEFDSTSSNSLTDRENLSFNIYLREVAFYTTIRKAARDPWLAIISEIAEARGQILRYASLVKPGLSLSELRDNYEKICETIQAREEAAAVNAIEKHFEMTIEWYKHVKDELREVSFDA